MTRKGVAPAVAAGVGLVLLLLAGAAAFSMVNGGFFSIGQGDDCEFSSVLKDNGEAYTSISEVRKEFEDNNPDADWENFKEKHKIEVVDGVVKAERCQK
jgi:hypothetical protein